MNGYWKRAITHRKLWKSMIGHLLKRYDTSMKNEKWMTRIVNAGLSGTRLSNETQFTTCCSIMQPLTTCREASISIRMSVYIFRYKYICSDIYIGILWTVNKRNDKRITIYSDTFQSLSYKGNFREKKPYL